MDFLQRLAASALGEPPGERAGDATRGDLRAALPSPFEPVSAATFETAPRARAATSHTLDGRGPDRPSAPRRSPAPVAPSASMADARRSRAAARHDADDDPSSARGSRSTRLHDGSPTHPDTALRTADSAEAAARARHATAPHTPGDRQDAKRPAAAPSAAPRDGRPAQADARASRIAAVPAGSPAGWPQGSPQGSQMAPLDTAVVASLNARASAATSASGPPVVHVTIERIDVRSAPPAAQGEAGAVAPRARANRTLADYLRRGSR